MTEGLAVIETHPVQYHAPVYRSLQRDFDIPVTAIYASDHSVTGYIDDEFGTELAWDTDLLSGYTPRFLTRGKQSGEADGSSVFQIQSALVEIDPSAVLNVGYSPAFYRRALRASAQSHKPLLFRAETTDHAQDRNLAKRKLRDLYLKRLYRSCAGLLYIGERSRNHYARLGVPPETLWFSPYCVDTDPFQSDETERVMLRKETRHALGLPEDRTVLLFSGKLVHRKGVELLLHAVKQLDDDERGKITVLFLGSGDRESDLRRVAETEPGVDTRFLGFKNQTELSSHYHAADALVLPSVEGETWGLVVNEALHHGLPCVVSEAVGCSSDLILEGETGFVVPTGSRDELATGLRQIRTLMGREAIRTRCREHVAGYSVLEAAKGVADAFRSVVGGLTRRVDG